jgi:tRNA(fMet)-specific endonuclease VapC
MKYLIDTDWIIDHLRGKEEMRNKLKEFKPSGIAVSIISLAELYEGVYYSKNQEKSQKQLETLLTQFSLLEVDKETCKIFGKERGRLRKAGKIICDFDLLIASTALSHNLTILSNNSKHFERLEGLNIISV